MSAVARRSRRISTGSIRRCGIPGDAKRDAGELARRQIHVQWKETLLMSDLNSLHNRAVWFDIPVANLDRASAFYAATLGVAVHKTEFDNFKFSVLDHDQGNGGCLIPNEAEIS